MACPDLFVKSLNLRVAPMSPLEQVFVLVVEGCNAVLQDTLGLGVRFGQVAPLMVISGNDEKSVT